MAAIIGGGVSGCVLARRLAEQHHVVHLYEAGTHFGGLAYAGLYPFTLETQRAREFLENRAAILTQSTGHFYPKGGWHTFCQSLLDHKNIHALHNAAVENPVFLLEEYPLVFSTARPDELLLSCYGALGYLQGLPLWRNEDTRIYNSYMSLLSRLGIVPLGSSGTYHYLTIEQCIVRALQTADIYAAYLLHKSKAKRDIALEVTWHGI